MSNRGRGSCLPCSEGYSNRLKPTSCRTCGYDLGGKFHLKKTKFHNAPVAEICHGLLSCWTTGKHDRCFVTNQDEIWQWQQWGDIIIIIIIISLSMGSISYVKVKRKEKLKLNIPCHVSSLATGLLLWSILQNIAVAIMLVSQDVRRIVSTIS